MQVSYFFPPFVTAPDSISAVVMPVSPMIVQLCHAATQGAVHVSLFQSLISFCRRPTSAVGLCPDLVQCISSSGTES